MQLSRGWRLLSGERGLFFEHSGVRIPMSRAMRDANGYVMDILPVRLVFLVLRLGGSRGEGSVVEASIRWLLLDRLDQLAGGGVVVTWGVRGMEGGWMERVETFEAEHARQLSFEGVLNPAAAAIAARRRRRENSVLRSTKGKVLWLMTANAI
jgi:hypothetical protein